MAEVRRSLGFPLSLHVMSNVGRVRTNNEDSHGHAWRDDESLFVIVADGMGGHEAGEVASGLAVQVVEEVVVQDTETDPRESLYNALLEANDAILEEGRRSGTRGMGTTSICAVYRGPEVFIALIGDSRFYHVRHGHTVWRTLDHTRVQMLVDQGEISEEESRTHPEAGMLTRALGHQRMADGRQLVPDVLAEPLSLEEGDACVMCSDGLHDLVDDWEIAQMVAGNTPEDASRSLIELACDRGGHDNVTVAVVIAGSRAGDYDPDFVPEPAEEEYIEEDEAEVTYDGHEEPMAPVAAAPVESSNSTMLMGVAAVGVVLVLGLVTLLAATFAAWFLLF